MQSTGTMLMTVSLLSALLIGVQFKQLSDIFVQVATQLERNNKLEGLLFQHQHMMYPHSYSIDPSQPRHIMFSTKRRTSHYQKASFENLVHRNSRHAVTSLGDRVTALIFEEDNPFVRKNRHGFPFLKDMYLQAQALVCFATIYRENVMKSFTVWIF
jgi:hypothetical protein